MTASDNPAYDAVLLTHYLLGALPPEEAEPLDELSITDESFVWRLSDVENDLVDTYARGELSDEQAKRFKNWYLSSPMRIQKMQFAKTLLMFEKRTDLAAGRTKTRIQEAVSDEAKLFPSKTSGWRPTPLWGFAGAALLLAALFLVAQDVRLHEQVASLRALQEDMTQQIARERAAHAAASKQLEQARPSPPDVSALQSVALLLTPPTRGAGHLPALSVPTRTDIVVLSLGLESASFKVYRAELKDLSANQAIWHSGELKPSAGGGNQFISLSFPASLLKSQNYSIELSGVHPPGAESVVASYTFHATVE